MDFLKRDDFIRPVHTGEITAGRFKFWRVTSADVVDLTSKYDTSESTDNLRFAADVVCRCLVNGDGKAMFGPDQLETVMTEMEAGTVTEMAGVIFESSGYSADAVSSAKKNLRKTRSYARSSGSRSRKGEA